jgi:hypothetical protein
LHQTGNPYDMSYVADDLLKGIKTALVDFVLKSPAFRMMYVTVLGAFGAWFTWYLLMGWIGRRKIRRLRVIDAALDALELELLAVEPVAVGSSSGAVGGALASIISAK